VTAVEVLVELVEAGVVLWVEGKHLRYRAPMVVLDDDCDGEVDEDAEDAVPWWRDADGDGHGDANHEVEACDQPDGYVGNSSDLDDTDASVHPGADRGCRCGLAGRSPSGHGARVILLALLGAFVRRREANSAPSPKPGTMTPS